MSCPMRSQLLLNLEWAHGARMMAGRVRPSALRLALLAGLILSTAWKGTPAQVVPGDSTECHDVPLNLPLPEPSTFLRQVSIMGDRFADLRQNYVCRTHLLIQPSKESSKPPLNEDYDSFYVHGREVHRLLAVNDHPLSEAEAAEERKRLEQEMQRSGETKATMVAPANLSSAVLTTDVFTEEKRVVRNGRSLIRFTLEETNEKNQRQFWSRLLDRSTGLS